MTSSTRFFSNTRIVNIRRARNTIRVGENTVVRGELLVYAHGGEIEIGDWSYIGENSRLWSGLSIMIGNRVMIAHDVNIFDNRTHPIDAVARHRHCRDIFQTGHPVDIDLGERPVRVEDDAWIGAGSIILRGVTIGAGSIVAAGSVVVRDVAPLVLVAGNPASVIKHLDEHYYGSEVGLTKSLN
jgi:acetyltransferase-like isoleucine patch superfamily enzyme